MKILAYDTSSEVLSIAISEDGKILEEFESPLFTRHSATLAPSIDIILKSHRMDVRDVDVIAIGLGPGSFTGLRVGVTTAKVLGWALSKKVVGVSSLEAIAYGVASSGVSDIAVMLDAKKQKLYAALYRTKNGHLHAVKKPMLVGVDDFLSMIKSPACFVGDGVFMHRDKVLKITEKLGNSVEDKGRSYPKAANVIKAALPLIQAKKFADPARLDPLYLHPRDCNVIKK